MASSNEITKGSHVVHINRPELHGTGTVTEFDVHGGRYYVAWPMPGSMALARSEDATTIELAPEPEEE